MKKAPWITAVAIGVVTAYQARKHWSLASTLLPLGLFGMSSATVQAATMTESMVQSYANAMKQAANGQNIARVAQLVSDDAIISMSRRGRTTSLDKSAYLKLLQDSWSQSTDYRYDIEINNVVITGDQARADVITTERWNKDGKATVLTTQSRATLLAANNNAVLLRAVAQVSID